MKTYNLDITGSTKEEAKEWITGVVENAGGSILNWINSGSGGGNPNVTFSIPDSSVDAVEAILLKEGYEKEDLQEA